MRILIFGGTFDPPHRGHLALLEAAAAAIRPERILVIPGWQTPLKATHPSAPPAARAALARLGLVEALPRPWRARARVDESELKSRRRVFTVETLERVKRAEPGAELHFACGSDSAASFPRWKDVDRLVALAQWWTASRPGAPASAPPHFRVLQHPMPAVSSTELRRRLSLGEPTGQALVAGVAREIGRRRLYGAQLRETLERSLPGERWEHTLAVARLADDLARRWGEDPDKARMAGLLHDAGRSVPVARLGEYALKRKLDVPRLAETAQKNPLLLHAYVSEDLARRRFGVEDADILSAVRKHTLGDETMSRLDRILFVADSCSADRAYPGVDQLRRAAFQDLDEAFEKCLANKLSDVLARRGWLHPQTVNTWNSLLSK